MGRLGRHRRSRQAGFSLIEAIVAAAILGIALIGLVELHKGSMRGTVRAECVGRATEVARQIAEEVAALPSGNPALLPACAPGVGAPLPAPPNGCRATATSMVADRLNGCTYYTDEAAVSATDPSAFPDAGSNRRFRVDMAISQHPDALNYPNAPLLTVWVCWTDETGRVQEIQTSRIIW